MDTSSKSFIEIISRLLARIGMDGKIGLSDIDKGVISISEQKFSLLFVESLDTIISDRILDKFLDPVSLLFMTPEVKRESAHRFASKGINFISLNEMFSIGIKGIRLMYDGTSFFINPEDSTAAAKPESNYVESRNLMTLAILKVILCLLSLPDAINWTVRKVAETADVSVGSVQRSLQILKNHSFVFNTAKGRFLKNIHALLDIWVQGYNMVIRPKYFLGKASFRENISHIALNEELYSLPSGYTWGGEPAAYITNNFLKPEFFSIFTSGTYRDTCLDCTIIPRPTGNIEIIKKFWSDRLSDNILTAPVFVIYAQLMGSDDSRCVEAARRIIDYENFTD